MVLREPFSAFTVIEVAWFLRLAYCLEEAQAERDLQQMGSCLSAVLRMAHALDAPRLLKKVEKHIAGKVGVHNPCPQLLLGQLQQCGKLATGSHAGPGRGGQGHVNVTVRSL